jgi:hypothetical protein
VEQTGKPVAKNVELLWNRPESLLLKILLTKQIIKIKVIQNDKNIVK